MPGSSRPEHHRWWYDRMPSVAIFVLLLSLITVATVLVGRRVAGVLPEVGRDHRGEDTWSASLGMNIAGGFQVARIPDCAAGAFTRMVLWDADSKPYWEISGPPTPLTAFVVGVAPDEFEVETAYRDPPADALLRLVAFRRDGGPVGIRFRAEDLVESRVVGMQPLQRFTISGFQGADVCSGSDSTGRTTATTDTTDTSTPGTDTSTPGTDQDSVPGGD